jgi:hypothetical protein
LNDISTFDCLAFKNRNMRKISLVILTLATLAACSGSNEVEVGQKTTMAVDPVFDGGQVIKGEKVEAEFVVTNTGSYPLVISEVKGSCSCTVAEKPNDPIQPGEKGIIKADVDTDRTSLGVISKSIRIVANTEPSVTEVAIRAKVKAN